MCSSHTGFKTYCTIIVTKWCMRTKHYTILFDSLPNVFRVESSSINLHFYQNGISSSTFISSVYSSYLQTSVTTCFTLKYFVFTTLQHPWIMASAMLFLYTGHDRLIKSVTGYITSRTSKCFVV